VNTRERIIEVLEKCGIVLYEDVENINYEFVDSLSFVTMIMEIEKEFSIIIPDEFLLSERLQCISAFEILIKEQLHKIE